MDLSGLDNDEQSKDDNKSTDSDTSLYDEVESMTGGPDLIEIFGGSGSGKTAFSIEVMESAISKGMDVLFIDAERNVGDNSEIEGADYVYIPEWEDLYMYITSGISLDDECFGENNTGSNKLRDDYDFILFDSIGFPALVQYADYRISDNADQFKVFLQIQHITGKLKQYSQRNECMTFVTNQPKSELSSEDDPKPFGDKSIFGMKEVWKTFKKSSNPTATTCDVEAWRSRNHGKGSKLYRMKITDSGIDLTKPDEEEAGGWM